MYKLGYTSIECPSPGCLDNGVLEPRSVCICVPMDQTQGFMLAKLVVLLATESSPTKLTTSLQIPSYISTTCKNRTSPLSPRENSGSAIRLEFGVFRQSLNLLKVKGME